MNRCRKCAERRRNNQKEPFIPHEVPLRPWLKLGADLFKFEGQTYLCIVDNFSKEVSEISLLQSKTDSSVIIHLK